MTSTATAGLNAFLACKKRDGLFEFAARQRLPWHFNINKRYETLDVIN